MTSNAYMIRNDGKAIPCTQHIYGNDDIVEETLYAAEWLYDNTQHAETRALIVNFVAVWGQSLKGSDKTSSKILKDISYKPYRFLSKSFVNHISDSVDNYVEGNLEDLNKLVIKELNQEFLRARYGGIYNSNSASREMVFRISSVGFNWYTIIWEFIYSHKIDIDSVTIVRDEESTGTFGYYKGKSNIYKQMPIDEFLTEGGNPIVENLSLVNNNYVSITKNILYRLNSGCSIQSLYRLNINEHRLTSKLNVLNYIEAKKFVNICRSDNN